MSTDPSTSGTFPAITFGTTNEPTIETEADLHNGSVVGLRHRIADRLRADPAAWSVDGRAVAFIADFDLGATVGGFVTIVTPVGDRLLVQVHDLRLAVRDAVRLEVETGDLGAGASAVRSANVGLAVRFVEGDGMVLGALSQADQADQADEAFPPFGPAPGLGFSEGALCLATAAEVSAGLAASPETASLPVGVVAGIDVPAALRSVGMSRHSFLCGQSGSGKTYAMGVLLERVLVETRLPVVIIDPNSDHVGLGRIRTMAEINRRRTSLLTDDDHRELSSQFAAAGEVVVASAGVGDLPLRIHLSDLRLEEQSLTLGLDPLHDALEFSAFHDAVRGLASSPYGFVEVRTALLASGDPASAHLLRRIDNLGAAAWSIWADADSPSLTTTGIGHRVLVLDTGSLAEARERSVVALALLGRLRRRDHRSPVLLVIDEAHNVCPPDARAPLERAVADHVVWIAGEGRKFGIYLLLASQRPQKVHRNVISQCDNLLLMRVNSTADLLELSEVFAHVPASMVAEAKRFRLGEMIAAGPLAPTPIRLRVGERFTPEGGADLPTTWADVPL